MGTQVTATYRQYLALFCVIALLCPSLSARCCSELAGNKHSIDDMHSSVHSSNNPSMTHQASMLDGMAMAHHLTDSTLDTSLNSNLNTSLNSTLNSTLNMHSSMIAESCCDHTACDSSGCSAPVGLHVLSAFNDGLILAGVPYLADTSSPHFRERGALLRPPISA